MGHVLSGQSCSFCSQGVACVTKYLHTSKVTWRLYYDLSPLVVPALKELAYLTIHIMNARLVSEGACISDNTHSEYT